MRVLYPFEVQIFTSTPFKVTFRETLNDRRFFPRASFGSDSFFKLAYFFEIYAVHPVYLTDLTFIFSL